MRCTVDVLISELESRGNILQFMKRSVYEAICFSLAKDEYRVVLRNFKKIYSIVLYK